MPIPEYIRKCQKVMKDCAKKDYFSCVLPTLLNRIEQIKSSLIEDRVAEDSAKKQAEKKIFSHLHDVMRETQEIVENKIQERIASGEIHDADQARKSVAGNIFQQLLAYLLAANVINGNISHHVIVTMSVKNIIESYAQISVNGDIMKPDSDVVVYCEEKENSPVINLSCKTSCRERAGQTYKWKLLCDLASCNCEHKEGNQNCPITRYNLEYLPTKRIITSFATVDFYDELTNPQISAMFNFFDHAYIAKTNSPSDRIFCLETIIDDINEAFQ